MEKPIFFIQKVNAVWDVLCLSIRGALEGKWKEQVIQ